MQSKTGLGGEGGVYAEGRGAREGFYRFGGWRGCTCLLIRASDYANREGPRAYRRTSLLDRACVSRSSLYICPRGLSAGAIPSSSSSSSSLRRLMSIQREMRARATRASVNAVVIDDVGSVPDPLDLLSSVTPLTRLLVHREFA